MIRVNADLKCRLKDTIRDTRLIPKVWDATPILSAVMFGCSTNTVMTEFSSAGPAVSCYLFLFIDFSVW